jgi:hypothetical protein
MTQHEKDVEDLCNRIVTWWQNVSTKDVQATAAKAAEYGSGDLGVMGSAMLALTADKWSEADAGECNRTGLEMAIVFYLHGKVARALSAFQAGRFPSEDTLKDITVYSMMLRYVR